MKFRRRFVGETAALEIISRFYSFRGVEKQVMEIPGRRLIDFIEPLFLFLFFISPGPGWDGNACALGKKAQRFAEVQALLLHNEGESVTASIAAEAMPALLFRINKEGGVSFVVKRTEPDQIAPRLFQRNVLADDAGNIRFLFDFVNNTHLTG
ncbi:hypothetical protein ES703_45493 [subsurface metagenome]